MNFLHFSNQIAKVAAKYVRFVFGWKYQKVVGIGWGSIGHAFTVRIRTGNQNQTSFYPFVPHEISVLVELILGHLRYLLTDVPPQPNSPPDNVFRPDRPAEAGLGSKKRGRAPPPIHGISKITLKVVVFQFRRSSHLSYTSQVISQSRTRVKLNRVFFPR